MYWHFVLVGWVLAVRVRFSEYDSHLLVPLAARQETQDEEELNIAPKKANWDLKRDVEKKLEKLSRRTQRAIVEIIRERMAEVHIHHSTFVYSQYFAVRIRVGELISCWYPVGTLRL